MATTRPIHPILEHAIRQASNPRELHGKKPRATIVAPPGGWQLGAPLELAFPDQLRLAIWAGRVWHPATDETNPNEIIFRACERWLADPASITIQELLAVEPRTPHSEFSNHTLHGLAAFMNGATSIAEKYVRGAIGRATPSAYDRGKPTHTAFLAELDARMMTLEMQARLRPVNADAAARIASVRFRAVKPAEVRIAELSGGTWGALVREPRAQWRWIEGTKEDAIAAVPASVRAAAVARLGP